MARNLIEANYEIDDEFIVPGSNAAVEIHAQMEEAVAQMNEADQRYDKYDLARIIALIRSGARYPGVHSDKMLAAFRDAAEYAERTGRKARVLYEIALQAWGNNRRDNRSYFFDRVGAAFLQEGPYSLDANRVATIITRTLLYMNMLPWEMSDELQGILEDIKTDPQRFIGIPRHRELGLDTFLSELFFPPDSYLDFTDEDMDRLRAMDTLSADMLLLGHYSSPYVQEYGKAAEYARSGFARDPDTRHVIYSRALLLALRSFFHIDQYADMILYYEDHISLADQDPATIPKVQLYAAAAYELTGDTASAQRLFQEALRGAVFFNQQTYDREYGFFDSPPANMEILLYEIFFTLRDVFVKNGTTAEWAMPILEAEVERAAEERAPY
ncbi:hypothetical protein [Spirochaeta africana]|nr:hypothetical protein [Spirochaeta africana]